VGDEEEIAFAVRFSTCARDAAPILSRMQDSPRKNSPGDYGGNIKGFTTHQFASGRRGP